MTMIFLSSVRDLVGLRSLPFPSPSPDFVARNLAFEKAGYIRAGPAIPLRPDRRIHLLVGFLPVNFIRVCLFQTPVTAS